MDKLAWGLWALVAMKAIETVIYVRFERKYWEKLK